MAVIYRSPEAGEAEILAELGRETFVETFADLYSDQDLARFLQEVYAANIVKAELSNPHLHFRIAADDGEFVGFCKIHEGVSLDYDPGNKKVVELKQLYIRESHQGGGAAHQLIKWAIDKAAELGGDEMLLSVFSENIRAQRFYKRHGFFHIGDTIFMVGSQKDHEFMFLKQLK